VVDVVDDPVAALEADQVFGGNNDVLGSEDPVLKSALRPSFWLIL